jgi:hypothetical protein
MLTGALLAGCAAGGAGAPPMSAPTNLQSTAALQFAVGTANIGQTGTVGLNTVETFRDTSGLSATLVNTPTITGPANFAVPATAPANDANTNHISGTPQNLNPNVPNLSVTFGQTGGAFAYGFGPDNIANTGSAVYSIYTQPFFSNSSSTSVNLRYVGGPPAFPFFNDGTMPTAANGTGGFYGYAPGFTMFNATPVSGTYSLSVVVASSNAGTQTFTASGSLSNTTPLPALPAPAFTEDGKGGGSGTIAVPGDSRIVETLVYFYNLKNGTYFTVGPLTGTGSLSFALPDTLGPCNGSGCQNGANATPTLITGQPYRFYAATFDYPAFEAAPPKNTQQKPTITGANGQADISTSPATTVAAY